MQMHNKLAGWIEIFTGNTNAKPCGAAQSLGPKVVTIY